MVVGYDMPLLIPDKAAAASLGNLTAGIEEKTALDGCVGDKYDRPRGLLEKLHQVLFLRAQSRLGRRRGKIRQGAGEVRNRRYAGYHSAKKDRKKQTARPGEHNPRDKFPHSRSPILFDSDRLFLTYFILMRTLPETSGLTVFS